MQTGFYWVHLRYQVTVSEWADEWQILLYDADDDTWEECGTDQSMPSSHIVEVDPGPLQREP